MIVMDPVDDIYSVDKSEKLFEDSSQVLDEEERLELLQSLKKKGLCTRDIMSFLKNQADLRVNNKALDMVISNCAMRSKVMDCRQTLTSKKKCRTKNIKSFLKNVEPWSKTMFDN